jgi:hypothetical protein
LGDRRNVGESSYNSGDGNGLAVCDDGDDEVTANAATYLCLEAPNPRNLYKANIYTLGFRNV